MSKHPESQQATNTASHIALLTMACTLNSFNYKDIRTLYEAYGPWWNPAIEDQASDCAHRIGQERPVTVYRLIAAGTIEEKIIRLHQNKRSMADALLQDADIFAQISADDVIRLLRESVEAIG